MLEIRALRHQYDDTPVLHDLDLAVNQGEIMCLLGPSGCGKTTLLRVVAGLERPSAGEVRLGGQPLAAVPVHRRGFGLMFQDFALFPHMNVLDNVRFGLRMDGLPQKEQTQRARDILHLVGLADYADRDVTQLSGGERQRVALARSLAPNPRLLMLDEPLGSLDAALRTRLVSDLRDIIKQVGLTALYVTHDQAEAFAIADRIALMNRGRFEHIGPPREVYQHPKSIFAAEFLGLRTMLPVLGRDETHVRTLIGHFAVSGEGSWLLFHPDGLALTENEDGIPGVVVERVFAGAQYRLKVAHERDIVFEFHISARGVVPEVGQAVRLHAHHLVLIL